MQELYQTQYYTEALTFLATAAIIIPLFKKLKLSPINGFILSGAILGPFGLGGLHDSSGLLDLVTINNTGEIARIAELGVVFLMFMIGLELSLERLWHSKKFVFGLGSAQIVLCSGALAYAAYRTGLSAAAGVVIGAALSLSSTAIIIPTLAEEDRLHLVSGQASFSVLLFQDLAVAPLLVMVSLMGGGGGEDLGASLFRSLAPGVGAVVALIAVGRLVFRPLFHWVGATRSAELFMALCLLVILGTAYVTAASGQSMALGAFLAGLLLAETEFRRQIEAIIEPFKGLLLGLFFLSVGATLDLGQVFGRFPEVAGATVAFILIKGAVTCAAARATGLSWNAAKDAALAIAGGGEFAFVLLSPSMSGQIVPLEAANTAMAGVTLSMFLVPYLIGLGARFPKRAAATTQELEYEPPAGENGPAVILAGYGRVGSIVGRMLARNDIPFIAIDDDVGVVARQRRHSGPVFFGDAANQELLVRCGVREARALVVTVGDRNVVNAAVTAARAENPLLPIIVRATDVRHAKKLYRLGATDTIVKDIDPSLHLSELVLMEVGVPSGRVVASIDDQRDSYRVALSRGRKRGA